MVSWKSVLKFAAVASGVMVALQLVFYVLFEVIEYDSYLLNITLIASLIVAIVFLVLWNLAKKALTYFNYPNLFFFLGMFVNVKNIITLQTNP